eukprot:TRINITY_DN109712_c0_g1_i1.p1 TRINITY_DN109712_c0_g1~~TRINITY_DN109712_c0_g1_i1.p1  ORF type:complete len:716 (-),score=106.53 TRINITY_DN109712_c0_g1_i1:154-2301(-)
MFSYQVAFLGFAAFQSARLIDAVRQTSFSLDGEHVMQAATTMDLGICSQGIVEETSKLIDNGQASGKGAIICSKSEMQELLVASPDTMSEMWKTLNLPEDPTCEAVCKAVAQELDQRQRLPPRSDYGCILVAGKMECSIDFSETSIAEFANFTGDLPDFHDKRSVQSVEEQKEEAEWSAQARSKLETVHDDEPPENSHHTWDEWNLLRTVANLFRIYPPSDTTVAGSTSKEGSLVELGKVDFDERDVKQTNEKAQACLAATIKRFNARQTKTSINKWFGAGAFNDNLGRRKEVQRLLLAVHNMLGNTVFVFPGDVCSDNTFAYVYPRAGRTVKDHCDGRLPAKDEKCVKNSEGKFVIFLCNLYMTRPEERIETLLHEGSHHATAFTDDVCMDNYYHGSVEEIFHTVSRSEVPVGKLQVGGIIWVEPPSGYSEGTFKLIGGDCMAKIVKIEGDSVELKMFTADGGSSGGCEHKGYGRTQCMTLAKLSQKKAIRNADSLCYYISDVSKDISKIAASDATDCVQSGRKFCVGDAVKYRPIGGRGDITDGHGTTITSNLQGVILYPGSGEGHSPLQKFLVTDRVDVSEWGDDKWQPATVISINPPIVRYDPGEPSKVYSFEGVRRSGNGDPFVKAEGYGKSPLARFKPGDRVDTRWEEKEPKSGKVVSVDPPMVQYDGEEKKLYQWSVVAALGGGVPVNVRFEGSRFVVSVPENDLSPA